jgi:hypothetical protein
MRGNINPRFARIIEAEERKEREKEALKAEKAARERENGNEGLGNGL